MRTQWRSLAGRILLLTVFCTAELMVISLWLDTDSLVQQTRLIEFTRDSGPWIVRGIVGFTAIFITFAYLNFKPALDKISDEVSRVGLRWSLFAAHCSAMAAFAGLSVVLFGGRGSGIPVDLLAAAWFLTGISAIAFAALAFLPYAGWRQLVLRTGYLWAYAAAAVVSACVIGGMFRSLWQPACYLTFSLTGFFLRPFVSAMTADPTAFVIGTERFQVEIAPQCSGLEGVGLMLAFGILWLVMFRKECRFPRSLILIPLAVAIVFILNSLRIAALILIGNAGASEIALEGFHSQAGWIAVSAVGVGFACAIERLSWFKIKKGHPSPTAGSQAVTHEFFSI
jgi:exosortase/archaeosortase family protein